MSGEAFQGEADLLAHRLGALMSGVVEHDEFGVRPRLGERPRRAQRFRLEAAVTTAATAVRPLERFQPTELRTAQTAIAELVGSARVRAA